jgi:mannose-6-phosphate isomerase-like protein (cupin superfamily)
MGYEDIPPGQAIPPHHHPSADEILFVHRGSGTASLGTRTVPVTSGATIYIPRNIRISLRNTGAEPLSIAFIFSRPGFEEYLRETSVPEGAPAPPLSPEELAAIRARHTDQAIYEHP